MSNNESQSTEALEPCPFCGRTSKIEEFFVDDDPMPWYVATCVLCPIKTYDQVTPEIAAQYWNSRACAPAIDIPDGQWQHVQIKAGNPRVVAISFGTAEQAMAFINSFAASPVTSETDKGNKGVRE